ncbi:hypothetical protein HYU07_00925 [Candidatus Woesearchaeota archaeon]|nr:hypothetical protein [Candidatus Woesearchaeota archaeon]
MYVFGLNLPILELLVVFSIVVVGYLILLEIEFRQLRKIAGKFENEETELSKELKDLKEEVADLRAIIEATHKKR